jgi:hypothetical protein
MATVYTKRNVYIPRKQFLTPMGETGAIKIPGTDSLQHVPTELEYFVESLAREQKLILEETNNGLNPVSLKYYFKRQASREGLYLTYDITCHCDVNSKNLDEAILQFRQMMSKGDFDEGLYLNENNKRIGVLNNAEITPKGKYSVVKGNNHYGQFTLNQVIALFF